MSARQVWAIARLTVREAARRRILWVLLAIAVASVTVVGWGVDQLVSISRAHGTDDLSVDIAVSQVLILIAFLFSFVVATSAAFLAAPAIAGDIEAGTLLAVLARPMSRADLLLGRWLGLAAVIVVYTIVSAGFALGVVALISGYLPPHPAEAVAFLAGEALAVLTLALALGTRLPGIGAGAVSVGLFGLSWFGGVMGAVAVVFSAESIRPATDLLRVLMPTDLLWRGVVYALEPPVVLVLASGRTMGGEANPFFAAGPPTAPQVIWSIVWIGVVIVAAVLLFQRREL